MVNILNYELTDKIDDGSFSFCLTKSKNPLAISSPLDKSCSEILYKFFICFFSVLFMSDIK